MARWLKRGLDAGAIKAADAKVRETVEGILAEVEARKDLAIRELSERFDKWSPADFRLSPAEIERAIAQVPQGHYLMIDILVEIEAVAYKPVARD